MNNMQRFLNEVVEVPTDDGLISNETNQAVLSHVWQEVFHLLDAIPKEIADIDAGGIAGLVQGQLELAMLQRWLGEQDE